MRSFVLRLITFIGLLSYTSTLSFMRYFFLILSHITHSMLSATTELKGGTATVSIALPIRMIWNTRRATRPRATSARKNFLIKFMHLVVLDS